MNPSKRYNNMSRRLSKEDIEIIRNLYFEFNNSITNLSHQFKVSQKTIRYWVRDAEYRREVLEKNRRSEELRKIKKEILNYGDKNE